MNTFSFTLAHACMLAAALLPIVSAGIAKSGLMTKPRRDGGYDNDDPRAWLARQGDWRARANNAQANSFEALPFFLSAVIVAHQLGAVQSRLDLLAATFVVLRVIYIYLYVVNRASLRSLAWMAALAVNIAIFLVGVF